MIFAFKYIKIVLFATFFFALTMFVNGTEANDGLKNSAKISKILSKRKLNIQGYSINSSLINGIYSNFNHDLIWHNDEEVFNNNGRKAIEFLSKAEESGLDPADYSIKKINERLQANESKKIPYTDILITQMFVNLVSDMANGRKIQKEWEIEHYLKRRPLVVNYLEAVNDFLRIEDVEEFIEDYSPSHQQYKNLRKLLSTMLEKRDRVGKRKNIPYGKSISPGMKDYRVSMIRERLGNPIPLNPNKSVAKNFYDKSLQREVLALQQKHGLKTDAIIGSKTINALNMSAGKIVKKIKANMERYRWFSGEFEQDRIVVNIPEFRLRAYEDGQEKLSLTTIVGKLSKKTPLIATKMTDVIFHPYWYVPQEYAATQILPQVKANPDNYLIDEEYTLIDNSNGGWKTVDPATINWEEMTAENFKYIMRQDPGAKNALGPIKFNILNHLSIYLHGTTKPWLFSKRVRSYSSGCVRVDGPIKLAYFVLQNNEDYDQAKIDEIFNSYDNDYEIPYYKKPVHKKMNLDKQIATYLTYFTIYADEDGNYNIFEDIYGWDSLL